MMNKLPFSLIQVDRIASTVNNYRRPPLGDSSIRITLSKKSERLLYTTDGCVYLKGDLISFIDPSFAGYWQTLNSKEIDYQCRFPAELIECNVSAELLFAINSLANTIMLIPDRQHTNYIAAIFQNMIEELSSDYMYKYIAVNAWLHILIHELLKIKLTHPVTHVANPDSTFL